MRDLAHSASQGTLRCTACLAGNAEPVDSDPESEDSSTESVDSDPESEDSSTESVDSGSESEDSSAESVDSNIVGRTWAPAPNAFSNTFTRGW
ncbi:MAG: hypothetical protein ACK4RG_06360 [Fimbriimonadales bacterium]